MERIALVAFLAAALFVSPAAAEEDGAVDPAKRDPEGTIVFFEPPRVLEPAVAFLEHAPVIDGRLDRDLQGLAVREFSRAGKSNAENRDVRCHYRLAYGTDFLYLYVEAEADHLTFRDRAYQNGDGFAMVLCLPTEDDEPTRDFYVLACSAVDRPEREWTRHVFWYYNVDTIFLSTSEDTKLEFAEGDGAIRFELYLPWKDVHPYHPWISDVIGFNLMFTKAVGENETSWYRVIPGTVGGENMPRWYGRLVFEPPEIAGGPQTFVSTARGNVEEGVPVGGIAVTAAAGPATEEITAEARLGEGDVCRRARTEYACRSGVTRHDFEILAPDVPPGDYTIGWTSRGGGSAATLDLTVLPRFDPQDLRAKLAAAEGRISTGSHTTLEFNLERIERLLADLPDYEPASYERRVLVRILEQIGRASEGEDPYAAMTGAIRRAFRSDLDGTLQPYVVRVPEDYDPAVKYPLLVFLHGSASTETDILGFPYLSTGGMIEMGPYGRGPSNGFATPEAQTDVAEAVRDAIANYTIDTERIILTGFSMGGYGAYRTFYETPGKFRALAVFSGSPDLGRAYVPGCNPPDFLDPEFLKSFRDVPVFIYHGEQDRNVSYAKTLELVDRLRAAGARVEFRSDPDRGHEPPSDTAIEAYHRWLDEVLER